MKYKSINNDRGGGPKLISQAIKKKVRGDSFTTHSVYLQGVYKRSKDLYTPINY